MVKKKKAVHSGELPQQFGPSSRFEVQKGQLVKSKAGRDKDRYYLVLGREGNILYLADGRARGALNPKKKNIRHVAKSNRVAADHIAMASGRQLRNEEIRAALHELSGE